MSNSEIFQAPDDIEQRCLAASENEDFIRCMTYIQLREIGKQRSKASIAEHFGVSRPTLDKWILRWQQSGLLRQCRQAYMIPRAEEIRAAEDLLLDDWPEILHYARLLARGRGKSEKVAADMIMWLHEAIVKPRLEAQEEAGAEEFAYIEGTATKTTRFDPLSLPGVEDASPDTDPTG